MSKKKAKLHQITSPKSDKLSVHIDTRALALKSRNLVVLESMNLLKSNVVESKRNKKPKYKHKIYDDE